VHVWIAGRLLNYLRSLFRGLFDETGVSTLRAADGLMTDHRLFFIAANRLTALPYH
jgi:hypothetical protein